MLVRDYTLKMPPSLNISLDWVKQGVAVYLVAQHNDETGGVWYQILSPDFNYFNVSNIATNTSRLLIVRLLRLDPSGVAYNASDYMLNEVMRTECTFTRGFVNNNKPAIGVLTLTSNNEIIATSVIGT